MKSVQMVTINQQILNSVKLPKKKRLLSFVTKVMEIIQENRAKVRQRSQGFLVEELPLTKRELSNRITASEFLKL